MTFNEMIRRLREELVPRGTEPVVLLRPTGPLGSYVVDEDKLKAAIDQLAMLPVMQNFGRLSPLEELGAWVLLRSLFTAQRLQKAPPLNRMPDDCP